MTATPMTPAYLRYKLVNGTAEALRRQAAVRAAETAPAMSSETLARVGSIFDAGRAAA